MTNKLSDIGLAEELIRSYVQFGCAEIHAKGLYEKTLAEMDNGLIDVEDEEIRQKHLERLWMFQEDINECAEMRRNVMRLLSDMFDGDKALWCQAKHLGIAMMTLFEAYQASDNDPELLQMAYEANKLFNKAISRFLGVEVTSCSSCLADALKGANEGEE